MQTKECMKKTKWPIKYAHNWWSGKKPLISLLRVIARIESFRGLAIRIICNLEGGQFWSETFRELMKQYYNVEIGNYSYGPCLNPGNLPPGTKVGNYCSFGPNIRVFRRNHPFQFASTHPFFFNSRLGIIEEDSIEAVISNPLYIMHDVWIGSNVIIAPGCHCIGIGAVVAAGAVVTKDVPSYAVVAGNPARIIKSRFSEEICRELLESRWWEFRLDDLLSLLQLFTKKLTTESSRKVREYLCTRSIK